MGPTLVNLFNKGVIDQEEVLKLETANMATELQ